MEAYAVRQRVRREWLQRQRHRQGQVSADEDSADDEHALTMRGYSAKIYAHIECKDGGDLIELGPDNGAPNYADRYDVRHLLPPPDTIVRPPVTLPNPELHSARFAALSRNICEHEVFHMNAAQRRAYIAAIRDPDSATQPPAPKPESFAPSFAVPDGTHTPRTQCHFQIIEQTARFIADQPAKRAVQMEIMIQGKQGTNPNFDFLNRADSLHPFYTHLLWLMRSGLYAYNQASSSSDEETDPQPPEPAILSDLPPISATTSSDSADRAAGRVAGASGPGLAPRAETAGPAVQPDDPARPYSRNANECLAGGTGPPADETAPSAAADEDLKAKRRRRAAEFLRRKRAKE
ncbi:hypothetical protein LPJ63_002420 [Coemansia sp. RSA 2711]|nr:hypothetical protein LPJ63_002420 [Coemansia sp. RSA 2711]KAJ2315724.1 hypothetical protein IWW54_000093 [Coemansia sp. RSA 2705]KAJ2330201.1 hypothetical protein IWW51_000061 [Coemansia sp. RSA 2702]